jgi:predicted DNA-binding ribbon-helix-helix protein
VQTHMNGDVGVRRGKADRAGAGRRQSSLVTGNVRVAGRRTSVRLEPKMWAALEEIRIRERTTLPALVTQIERAKLATSLTAGIRIYLLLYFMSAATEEGHRAAGHGTLEPHPSGILPT